VKQTPKQFFATPAGKLTLAVIAMVLCWTVLIVYLSKTSAGGTWFPSEADIEGVRTDIKKDTNALHAAEAELDAFEDLQANYEDSLAGYWNADRDGQPETELRNLVSTAAQNAEANIQNLGSVRTSNINNELSYADLDFTVVDEYSKVIRFFAEIEKCTPRLAWRRVEIRLEPNRARAVTGPGARPGAAATAAATTPTAQMFRTTGQVRVIKYSPAGNTAKVTTAATKTATTASTAKTTTPAAGATTPTTPAAGATTPAAGATTPTTPAAGATTPAAARPATTNQPAAASAAATPAQQGPAANATTN
jgi:hypothetical protein